MHILLTQPFLFPLFFQNLTGYQLDPTHKETFFDELSRLYRVFPSDVYIKSSTPPPSSVAAHRVVLAAGNRILKELILSSSEKIDDTLDLSSFNERTLLAGLKMFYVAGLPVPVTLAGELLHLCKYLRLEDLSIQLETFMEQHLNAETAAYYYKSATLLEMPELKNDSLETILGQFNHVFLFEGFLTLTQEELVVILSDDRLSTGNQHDDIVFDAIIKWLEENNINEFNAQICHLFDCVRYDFVSHSYLKDNVLSNRFMKYFPQRTYATNAIKYQISNIRSTACIPKSPRTGLTSCVMLMVSKSNELLVYKTRGAQKRWQRILQLPLWCDAESMYNVVDGGVIVSGGLYKKSCLFYDSMKKDSVQFPNMSISSGKHGAAYYNGFLFVVGGSSAGLFECLDIAERVWVSLPPIPDVYLLQHPLVVACQTHVYVIGGTNKDGIISSTLYVYDIKQASWMQHDNIPIPCDATTAGATIIDEKVCVIANRTETIVSIPSSQINSYQEYKDGQVGYDLKRNEELQRPARNPVRVGQLINQLNEYKEKEECKANVPMCEGRLIGHLNDKHNVERIFINIMLLDMVNNKWEVLAEADTQLPNAQHIMQYQPINFNGKAAILVGTAELMSYDIEEKKWKSVHALPNVPKSIKNPSRGKVARFLCAQFSA